MISLFRRATRYVASDALDPGENRLTEVFAAVLERVPWLPAAFVHFLRPSLGFGIRDWRPRIRTQRFTAGGGIVDLEIELTRQRPRSPGFEDGDAVALTDRVLFWVEIKHGAEISGSQLKTYRRAIADERATHKDVFLLVPRGFEDRDHGVAVSEWQDWARALQRLRRQHGQESGGVADWLVGEFLRYLKEEELMDDERFTIDHVYATSLVPRTQAGFARIWEVVTRQLAPTWAHIGRSNNDSVLNMFRTYKLARDDPVISANWQGAWLEWGWRSDRFREDESRDAVVFFAGLSTRNKQNPLTIPGNAAWVAALESEGFHRVFSEMPRLWRLRYADSLLVHNSLDDAALDIASWVGDAFADLARNPPPA